MLVLNATKQEGKLWNSRFVYVCHDSSVRYGTWNPTSTMDKVGVGFIGVLSSYWGVALINFSVSFITINLNSLQSVAICSMINMENSNFPSELKCSLCHTLLKEAVMIPCCQHSFCLKCKLMLNYLLMLIDAVSFYLSSQQVLTWKTFCLLD